MRILESIIYLILGLYLYLGLTASIRFWIDKKKWQKPENKVKIIPSIERLVSQNGRTDNNFTGDRGTGNDTNGSDNTGADTNGNDNSISHDFEF